VKGGFQVTPRDCGKQISGSEARDYVTSYETSNPEMLNTNARKGLNVRTCERVNV
jgi:hypothetical protein